MTMHSVIINSDSSVHSVNVQCTVSLNSDDVHSMSVQCTVLIVYTVSIYNVATVSSNSDSVHSSKKSQDTWSKTTEIIIKEIFK